MKGDSFLISKILKYEENLGLHFVDNMHAVNQLHTHTQFLQEIFRAL